MKIVEAREQYATWLKGKGLNRRTVWQTLAGVRRFEVFLKWRGVEDVEVVTVPLVEDYKSRLQAQVSISTGNPLVARTVESYLAPVRSFLAQAAWNGWIRSNPAVGILRGVPRRVGIRNPITVSEMEKILARPDVAMPIGLRDRLILELMNSTGIRMEEVVGLDLSDVDFEQGRLHIKATTRGRDRWVALTATVRAYLDRYLKEIRPVWDRPMKRGGIRRRATALLYSPRRGPMSENILEKMVGGHVRAVRPDVENAGQSIREACAVRLLSTGATVAEVNALLGQLKMSQTEAYTRGMDVNHLRPGCG